MCSILYQHPNGLEYILYLVDLLAGLVRNVFLTEDQDVSGEEEEEEPDVVITDISDDDDWTVVTQM